MLTVVTPATSRRLTTVEHVRLDLGLPAGSPTDDRLHRLIDQATGMAERFCRCGFARETVLQTIRTCDLNRPLVLERGPVTAVDSLLWNGVAVEAAEFELDEGAVWRLSAGGARYFWGGSAVAVQYAAGYVLPGASNPPPGALALPADVELAAIRLVAALMSAGDRDPLVKSEDVDGVGSVSYWVPGSKSTLPSQEAEALLRQYRVARIR